MPMSHAGPIRPALDGDRQPFRAVRAYYDRVADEIVIRLATGVTVSVPRALLRGLETVSLADLRSIEISVSGFGLRIQRLDWDVSIVGIMLGRFGARSEH